MAKASMHFERANRGNHQHNDRTEKVEAEYLLPKQFRKENEVSCSAIEADKLLKKYYDEAKINYKNEVGQTLQSSSYSWEAVINLNENHTLEDIEKLTKEIEKETGFRVLQMSIHRDEGHIKKDKNGNEFAVYNYHAHISFFTLDATNGKQLMRMDVSPKERIKLKKELERRHPNFEKMPKPEYNKLYREIRKEKHNIVDKEKLSELQTLCATSLQMERGKKGSTAVRLGHNEYREVQMQMDKLRKKIKELENENKNNSSSELKEVKKELAELKSKTVKEKSEALATKEDWTKINLELRAELKANKAGRPEYAELEQLSRDLKKRISEKDLTITEMENRIKTLDFKLKLSEGYAQELQAENKELKKEIISLDDEAQKFCDDNHILKKEISELKKANEELKKALKPYESVTLMEKKPKKKKRIKP